MTFISIVKLLHTNIKASVIMGSGTTNSFPVNAVVKQGCVLAPTLFDIFLAAFLEFVSNRLPSKVDMSYQTYWNPFNLRRLQARTKVSSSAVVELQYADDYAVMALSELELQEIVTVFSDPYFKFGLSVNCKKIQLLYQGPPNGTAAVPPIRDCGEPLEVVRAK